jgi:L-amino acid N-acyltransferase YncA
VIVREATTADARGIAEVHVRAWQVAYAHVFPPEQLGALSVDEREARWREHNLVDRAIVTTVAERDAHIVGFAGVGSSRNRDADGELYAIYVLPEEWGRGIGDALMADALERLRAQRLWNAILWVLEDNPRTRRFYERHGWRPDGATKHETYLDTDVPLVRYRISLAQ